MKRLFRRFVNETKGVSKMTAAEACTAFNVWYRGIQRNHTKNPKLKNAYTRKHAVQKWMAEIFGLSLV